MAQTIKLAEALLRRKELQAKVNQVSSFKTQNLFEQRVQRIKVSDGIDEVTANVPKLALEQVTAEYDFYARQLRLIDAAIQQVNWTAEVTVDKNALHAYGEKV